VSDDLEKLFRLPAVPLGRWPTPLEPVAEFPAGTVLVKRDDLSGYGRGGVKTRKIEHLVGHVLARGYREVITGVGNITNLAYDLVPALRQHGIGLRLFVLDDPVLAPAVRERLFGGLGDQVRLLGRGHFRAFARMAGAYLRRWAGGGRPLLVLPSLAHPAAVAGSACGFVEMVRQRQAAGAPLPRAVYISSASGTTHAGLVLAEHLLRRTGTPPIRIVGARAAWGPTRWWVLGLIRWTERFLGLRRPVPPRRVVVRTEVACGGFGRFSAALVDLCGEVERVHGLRIDPVYGGKTWQAMLLDLAGSPPTLDRPMLFWHCGYSPGWNDYLQPAAAEDHPLRRSV
jgi:1-aminocyclopropane-1-carboxylate deaminase/D-cysteine desulfhydrase-like pyridoxal-dependent ACC family enzyme